MPTLVSAATKSASLSNAASQTATLLTGSAAGIDVNDFTDNGTAAAPVLTSSNWSQLASSGITFVGIKASEGNYFLDGDYKPYTAAAAAAGLYVMPYVFANPYQGDGTSAHPSHGSGTQQADYAWTNEIGAATPAYKSSSLMLPVVLDIEDDPATYISSEPGANSCYGLSQSAMVTWIGQFLVEMYNLSGKVPVIYTAPDFWATCTGNYTGFGSSPATGFKPSPLWMADYGVSSPPAMPGWSSSAFWQYTATGSALGITGAVDLDYLGPILQVSATGTPIAPVQLQTLSALNGLNAQPVTYSASSLPPGLSVSSSGQITGTPTTIGASQASVTASAGPPTAISFTWYVHGTLSLTPATVTSIAGDPVVLQVRDTDADVGATGYTPPVFTASGLPAGMAINSSGLITGWAQTPGTYKITVSAIDGLDATGTTTITWTVKAAADTGVTGAIRQNGGSSKCLDDPSSRTANGTAIDLAACTGKSNQSWTAAQDGSIRVLGLCLTASGTRVLLYGCNSTIGEEWHAGTDGALVSVRYGTCLTGPTKAVANGTLPTLATCTSSTSSTAQHWSRPVTPIVSGATGRCLTQSGTVVTMSTCGNLTSEHWTIASSGELGAASNGTCLTESGTAAGAAITATTCFNAASQHWTLVGAGTIPEEIRNAASGLCVTVPSGATANNTPMVLGACSTGANSTWRVG